MRISYLGPKGTFSEEAAKYYFRRFSNKVEFIEYETIPNVIQSVQRNECDKGIVPIENSIEGTINITLDSIVNSQLYIEGELICPVSLHLLGFEGTKLENIREIWSIAPALAQCNEFLNSTNALLVPYHSTALAASALRDLQKNNVAVIASENAALTYGLEIIQSNIQENESNFTRFFVVGEKNNEHELGKKTMLSIAPNDEYPGVLSSILNIFSSLQINLSWIESRPTKKKLGSYIFYLEAQACSSDINVEKAIQILSIYGHELKVLGCYNTHTKPIEI